MSTDTLEQLNTEVEATFEQCEKLLDEAIPLAETLLSSISNLQTQKLSKNEKGYYNNVNFYLKTFLQNIEYFKESAKKSIENYVKSPNETSLDTLYKETNILSNTLTILGDSGVLNFEYIEIEDKDLLKRLKEGTVYEEDHKIVAMLPSQDYFKIIMEKLGNLEAVQYRDNLCSYLHDAHWKIEHIHMHLIPEIRKVLG